MSLAWCPECKILTNDLSRPCHKCGGALEFASMEPLRTVESGFLHGPPVKSDVKQLGEE